MSFGDQTKTTYSTTHTESFSGKSQDGRPLIFQLRDPCFPSQHYSSVDISNILKKESLYTSTHSRDVYSPKDGLPLSVLQSLRTRNRTVNREGLSVKEVTNPPDSTSYSSSSHSQHRSPAFSSLHTAACGLPTPWHQHNILTGEDRVSAGPGTQRRKSRERQIWANRCWEMDCTSLRLY